MKQVDMPDEELIVLGRVVAAQVQQVNWDSLGGWELRLGGQVYVDGRTALAVLRGQGAKVEMTEDAWVVTWDPQ